MESSQRNQNWFKLWIINIRTNQRDWMHKQNIRKLTNYRNK